MPLTAEQKTLIKDPDILREIEDDEREIARLNRENGDKRTRASKAESERATKETELNDLKGTLKELGFNADALTAAEIREQFPVLVEKITKDKGLKPQSEVDSFKKELDKMKKELADARAASEKDKHDAMVEKVGGLFEQDLQENFGKAAAFIRKQLRLEARFTIKDGVEGIQNGDEFVPRNAEKGNQSAIDQLKKEYADFVVTKQKPGSNGNPGTKAPGAGPQEGMLTRAEFEALDPFKRPAYMAKYGGFAE